MTYPRISIITPSYNQGKYLEQTIESVLNQNYPNLEYIIIDGGSNDDSVEIIKKYEKHLAYWITEKDSGQSNAINKGIRKSTGDVINWLNSDDYYEPGTLKIIAETFSDSEVKVVSGRGRLFRDDKTLGYTKGVDVYKNNLEKTIGWVRMDQPETFFRKSVIEKIGLLDERLHYLMDRDWWLKYLLFFGMDGVKKITDVLVNFRIHNESKTVMQKEMFEADHHAFFYSLARKCSLSGIARAILQTSNVNLEYTLDVNLQKNKLDVGKIFSYYFFLRGNISYEENKKDIASYFYDLVNIQDLEKDDQLLYTKMKFRNRLPVLFVKLARMITRNKMIADL